ncbi:aspartyl-phosphate phosphatase Spo0E family protein [Wukongibacter baidiensis]|uniref:aspartyl-phosphate phosphatase Spo0E family protein n=1 Tax=Wukongibacter baidiensis TaxID=1723361 RepID=UPI003D7FBA96
MGQVEAIVFEIEALREQLNSMINEKRSFTDFKIIEMSRKLDIALNRYNELVESYENSD